MTPIIILAGLVSHCHTFNLKTYKYEKYISKIPFNFFFIVFR